MLPLLHCFHQYSCDTTTITSHSPIWVWYYHYYIVFTNIRVILSLLHCNQQYSCDATIITLCYCDVPEFIPGFYWVSCYLIFSFTSMFCRSFFVLLYFFLLAIVLSVILGFTDYDYSFGIFKVLCIEYVINYCDVQGNVFVSQFCWIYTTLCNWLNGTKYQFLKWQWILFFWCICVIVSYANKNYMLLPLFV